MLPVQSVPPLFFGTIQSNSNHKVMGDPHPTHSQTALRGMYPSGYIGIERDLPYQVINKRGLSYWISTKRDLPYQVINKRGLSYWISTKRDLPYQVINKRGLSYWISTKRDLPCWVGNALCFTGYGQSISIHTS